jgi:hypothetical protein
MAANLVTNARAAFGNQPVSLHCWLDSTVALYWINGDYRQFEANRVNKIRQLDQITWHQVPTTDNPADVGSRGGNAVNNELWQNGPLWLSRQSEWPPDARLEPSPETQAEAKAIKEILATVTPEADIFDQLLDKHQLPKLLRIGAWIRRFITNCRKRRGEREVGPIKTSETKQHKVWWIRRVKRQSRGDPHFQADQLQLNLQPNKVHVLECRGRIVGEYPIYLMDVHPFTAKVALSSLINNPWRNWDHNCKDPRMLLGTATAQIDKEDFEKLLWL